MSEIAHINKTLTQSYQEPRRTKLQEAVGGIPPGKLDQEIAAALDFNRERRAELKSKLDELATDELERLLSYSRTNA